jgi:hypothetical protein
MKYLAYLEQESEGCDYSIACGQTTWRFDADDNDQALRKLTLKVSDNYNHCEAMLGHIILYEINNEIQIDVKDIYDDINMSEQEKERLELESLERKELDRLKEKYE